MAFETKTLLPDTDPDLAALAAGDRVIGPRRYTVTEPARHAGGDAVMLGVRHPDGSVEDLYFEALDADDLRFAVLRSPGGAAAGAP